MKSVKDAFDLSGVVAVITGGAGLLGPKHAEAIAEMGAHSALWDVDVAKAEHVAGEVAAESGTKALGLACDVTNPDDVASALEITERELGPVQILINNAAKNPKVEAQAEGSHWSRLESFPLSVWRDDLAVGLTGAFLCSRIIGAKMAERGKGAILNIASDLALIAPDQRIYQQPGLPEDQQMVKPVTYSVVKAGLIGLTRYLATYWADKGVRVNSISPGGVFAGQDEDFVKRLTQLIPMGRMAHEDEYKAAIVFLVSEASSYMTGANLSVDGGRTCW